MLPACVSAVLCLLEAAWLVIFRQPEIKYSGLPHILNAVPSTAVIMTSALLSPAVQQSLSIRGILWTGLGQPVAKSNVSGQARLCSDCEPHWHVIILGSWLIYNNILVLRVKHATISSAVGLAFHEVLSYLLGVNTIRQSLYLLVTCMVSLVAKRQLEVQEGNVVSQQSEQRLQAMQEKILRHDAEFRLEKLLSHNSGASRCLELQSRDKPSDDSDSVMSGPATFSCLPNPCVRDQLCSGSACLPLDAHVWEEGHCTPQPVGSLRSTSQVLCYDEWTGQVKYVEVFHVESSTAQQSSWISVTLEDGCSQQMTANHPIHPYVAGKPYPTIPAESLRPGLHCLPVLKLVLVPVSSVVRCCNSDAEEAGRISRQSKQVSVAVSEPNRFSILISSLNVLSRETLMHNMAVGSVLNSRDAKHTLPVKNTFIANTVEHQDDQRDCISEPPSLYRDDIKDVFKNSHQPVDVQAQQCEVSSSCGSSQVSVSAPSSDSASIEMWDTELARVSCQVKLRAQGLPSTGSDRHNAGTCHPCLFMDNRWKVKCWKGSLCSHCHFHDGRPRRVKRQPVRQMMQLAATSSNPSCMTSQ